MYICCSLILPHSNLTNTPTSPAKLLKMGLYKNIFRMLSAPGESLPQCRAEPQSYLPVKQTAALSLSRLVGGRRLQLTPTAVL